VDDGGLVTKLEEAARAASRRVELLVQVDLAGEPTKRGVLPAQLGAILAATRGTSAVRLTGLMLLPAGSNRSRSRSPPTLPRSGAFVTSSWRMARSPLHSLSLSMGMSHDFEVAIEEGATMVRVGTAIFGPRAATSD
jgi:uncharacterized pyridoxal phosphate-containing UPF0001 family protein